eukprot:gene2563-3525_t
MKILTIVLLITTFFNFCTSDVITWGYGANGRLGTSNQANQQFPFAINSSLLSSSKNLRNKIVKKITCGNTHCIILTDDGNLFGYGGNNMAQTGTTASTVPNNVLSIDKVLVGLYTSISPRRIIDLASSYATNMILLDDKTIRCWGSNSNSECGNGTQTTFQAANDLATTTMLQPVSRIFGAVGDNFYIISETGLVFSTGKSSKGQRCTASTTTPSQLVISGVLDIVAGYQTVFFFTNAETYVCGDNSKGQLGLLLPSSYTTPTIATSVFGVKPYFVSNGLDHTIYLTSDTEKGVLKGCGDGTRGQLGTGNTLTPPIGTSVLVSNMTDLANSTIQLIKANRYFTHVLDSSERVHAWGDNGNSGLGMAGASALVPQKLPTLWEKPITRIEGAETSVVTLSPCSSGGIFSVDCICEDVDDHLIQKVLKTCNTPGCQSITGIKFDSDTKSANITVELLMSDFDTTEKYVNISNPYGESTIAPNQTRNCDKYVKILETDLNSQMLSEGMIDLIIKPNDAVERNCSGNVITSLMTIRSLPCFNLPNIWLTGDDTTELVNNIPLTLVGISLDPGVKEKAFKFNSIFSRIDFSVRNQIADDFSVAFWFKTKSPESTQTIFSYTGLNNEGFGMSLTAEPNLTFSIKGTSYTSSIQPTDTIFHHYGLTLDSKLNVVKMFFDGALVSTISLNSNYTIPKNGRMVIGQKFDNIAVKIFSEGYNIRGEIDEFKLFTKVINKANMYSLSQQRDGTSLWKCNGNANDELELNYGLVSSMQYNSSWDFNTGGLDKYIMFDPMASTRFPTSDFTISMFFKTNANNGSFFSYGTPLSVNALAFGIVNGKYTFRIDGQIINTGISNYGMNSKSFIAVTWKSYTGKLRMYGNDHTLIYEHPTPVAKLKKLPKGGTWYFGQLQKRTARYLDSNMFYSGEIGPVALWNTVKKFGNCNGKTDNDKNVCNGKGYCVDSKCICNKGYSGNNCQIEDTCFGKSYSSLDVCNGVGTCVSGNCTCIPGYAGDQCQHKMELIFFISNLCKENCTIDLSFYYPCLLIEGPSCYCGMNKNGASIKCNAQNEIEIVNLSNQGLSGETKSSSLKTYTSLKELSISNNPGLNVSQLQNILNSNIEKINLNGIPGSYSTTELDFSPQQFPNLKEIRAEDLILCGPYLWSKNLSLTTNFSSIRCSKDIHPSCDEMGTFDTETVFPPETTLPTSDSLSFDNLGACFSNSSYLRCITVANETTYETTPLFVSLGSNTVICDISKNRGQKSEVYISWSTNGVRLTKKKYFYILEKTFIQTKEFTYTNLGGAINASLISSSKYMADIQKYLTCSVEANNTGVIKRYPVDFNGTEDQFNCYIPASSNHKSSFDDTRYFIKFEFVKDGTITSLSEFDSASVIIIDPTTDIDASPGVVPTGISTLIGLISSKFFNSSAPYGDVEMLMSVNNTFYATESPYFKVQSYGNIPLASMMNFYQGKFNYFTIGTYLTLTSLEGYNIHDNYVGISSECIYNIDFGETGTFYVWIYGYSDALQGKGIHIGLDHEPVSSGKSLLFTDIANWQNTLENNMTAHLNISTTGKHSISIWFRDRNVNIRNLILTKNAAFVPSGTYPSNTIINENTLKSQIQLDVEGEASASIWFRHNASNVLLKASKDFQLVTIKPFNIHEFHPKGIFKDIPVNITLKTNTTSYISDRILYRFYTPTVNAAQILTRVGDDFYISSTYTFSIFTEYSGYISAINKDSKIFSYPQLSNFVEVAAFAPVTWNGHFPFVTDLLPSPLNISIAVTGAVPPEKYFHLVYCQYTNELNETFTTPAKRLSSTSVQCTLNLPTTFSRLNSDFLYIGLWVNASSSMDTYSFFISNQVYHILLKQPMTTTYPIVRSTQSLQTESFLLNITSKESIGIYNPGFNTFVKWISDSNEYTLSTSSSGETFTLLGLTIILPSFPIKYHLKFSYYWHGNTIEVLTHERYITENVTAISEISFLNAPSVDKIPVKFKLSKKLNPAFNYYIEDSRDSSIQYLNMTTETDEITGYFNSSVEENFQVSIKVDSNITELVEIVPEKSKLEFIELKTEPRYFSNDISPTFKLMNNNTQNYVFPSKYLSALYLVEMNFQNTDESLSHKICNLTSTESICGEYAINTFDGLRLYSPSIYLNYMSEGRQTLIHSTNAIFGFQKSSIINYGPLASLERNYEIYFNFEKTVFKIDADAEKYITRNYFCNVTGSTIEYNATLISSNELYCIIPYFGMDEILIDIYLRIPEISNDSVIINTNTITGYFMNQGNISFTSPSQTQFFYATVDSDPVFISLNATIPAALLSKVVCYADQISGTLLLSTVNNMTYHYRCTFNLPREKSGLRKIGMYFTDDDDGYHAKPFLVSGNNLNLTFVANTTISAKDPVASVFNTSVSLDLTTTFLMYDYGDVKYYCFYGLEEGDIYQYSTPANLSNSIFNCNLFSPAIVSFQVSIWMESFGIQRVIVKEPVQYKFLDDFLTPSFGVDSGNEEKKILKYNKPVSDIKFAVNGTAIFNCSKVDADLVCTSPDVRGILEPFKAYELNYTESNSQLGISYIVYERRTIISIAPSVMPSVTDPFPMTITVDSAFTLKEGNVVIQVGVGVDPRRYELTNTGAPTKTMTTSGVSSFPTGNYSVGLFYKNSQSLELNNQFQFTQLVPIDFVDNTGSISFYNGSNIQYINTELRVFIKHSKPVDDKFKKFVICKLGTVAATTTVFSNGSVDGYTCNFKHTSAGVVNVTLWYSNENTNDGEFKLAQNGLPIVFVEQVTATDVDPYVSAITDTSFFSIQSFVFTTADTKNDVYGTQVSYQCAYENQTILATKKDADFVCEISTNYGTTREVQISLHIVSVLTGYRLNFTSNTKPFLFYARKEINIDPFADVVVKNTDIPHSYNITLSVDYPFSTGLICEYQTTSDGTKTSAAIKLGNDTVCTISQSTFNTQTETIKVKLKVQNSKFDSRAHILSKNVDEFIFFKGPIMFDSTDNIINFETMKNKTFINSTIPTVPNRKYQMNCEAQYPVTEVISNINECMFNQNERPYCLNLTLHPNYIPALYNFTIQVQNTKTNKWFSLNIHPVTYYDEIPSFNRVIPHFSSIIDTYKKKKIYIARLSRQHNAKQFKYYCKVNYGGNDYFEYARLEPTELDIACAISNDLKQTSMSLQIYFENLSNQNKILFSSNSQVIQNYKIMKIDKMVGFSDGFVVGTEFPMKIPENQSDYSYLMKFEYAGSLHNLVDCIHDTNFMNCTFPKIVLFSNSETLQLELYLNSSGKEIQVFSLSPFIQINNLPIVEDVYPGSIVILDKSQYDIFFKSSQFVGLPSGENYSIRYIHDDGSILQENCKIINETNLSCPSPRFSVDGNITTLLSVNGIDYHDWKFNLRGISISLIGNSSLSISTFQVTQTPYFNVTPNAEIKNMFKYNLNKTVIRFYDDYLNIQMNIRIVFNSNNSEDWYFVGEVPTIWQYNVDFPRKLSVDLSFDSGVHFVAISNNKLTISDYYDNEATSMVLSTKYLPIGLRGRIHIENNPFYIFDTKVILQDVWNSTNIIHCPLKSDLNINGYSYRPDVPITVGNYSVSIIELSTNLRIPTSFSNILTFNFPMDGYEYFSYQFKRNTWNYLIHNQTQYTKGVDFLIIDKYSNKTGSDAFEMKSEIKIINDTHLSFKPNIPAIELLSKFELDSIRFCYEQIENCVDLYSQTSVLFTFNKKINIIGNYSIDSWQNDIGKEEAYTFRETKFKVKINEAPSLSVMAQAKIKISTVSFEYIFTQPNVTSNSTLEFFIPTFSTMTKKTDFNYPLTATLGISFTDGLEYATKELYITNKVKDVLLFQIIPHVIHPNVQTLTIQGTGFTNSTICQYSNGETSIVIGKSNGVFDGVSLLCTTPKIVDTKIVSLALINEFNETSNILNLTILPEPRIDSFIPSSGKSVGNQWIQVFGSFSNSTTYCKFNEFPCPKYCLFISSTELRCQVPSHPEGSAQLIISYNDYAQEFKSNSSFNFIPCDIGYSAENYSMPCEKCPKGTYKLKSGLFDCFPCEIGTFVNSTGAKICDACPIHSTTAETGAKSIYGCHCDKGYYRNPENHLDCITCPEGAICNFNTTIPIAKKGRWFSKELNNFIYYECSPADACPGGGEKNCSLGYDETSQLCARCSDGFFKEKAFCVRCGNLIETWIQFGIAKYKKNRFFWEIVDSNIMEYFVLVATLISLMAGFLFFADKIVPFDAVAKSILVIGTMIIIIGANIFVVIMIGYDIFVRRKKERKRAKNKRREREQIRRKQRRKREYEERHGLVNISNNKLDSQNEYDFRILDDPSESDEDNLTTINAIFDDLISIDRVKKKIELIRRRGRKYTVKIVKGADKIATRASNSNLKRLSTLIDVEKLESEMTKEERNLEEKKSHFSKVKKLIVVQNKINAQSEESVEVAKDVESE